jgi:hypothetical protein
LDGVVVAGAAVGLFGVQAAARPLNKPNCKTCRRESRLFITVLLV